ncbi:MAG: hypothetical protein WD734_00735 [Dehalococcoidia bacterium]
MTAPMLRARVSRVVLGLALVGSRSVTASPSSAGEARAQAATTIQVEGRVTSGTEGHEPAGDLTVRLVGLDEGEVAEAVEAEVRDGRYAVDAPASPGRTYIPHLVYEGVDYFAPPVAVDEASSATRDFLVYATTDEAPQLAITSTVVTVLAIDREQGQIGIEREDLVANPDDRVFVGDEAGVTLRIPSPEATLNASGQNADGEFTFENGVVSTTVPLRPGTLTSIVTRYLVEYDMAEDRYRLRVTAPLPTGEVRARVPVGFARAVEPGDGARRAEDEEAGRADEQAMRVAEATAPLSPGDGLLVDLVGLSGAAVQSNPLTESGGSSAALVAALVVIGGGVTVAARRRRDRDA